MMEKETLYFRYSGEWMSLEEKVSPLPPLLPMYVECSENVFWQFAACLRFFHG
jgi:hypothetical protein